MMELHGETISDQREVHNDMYFLCIGNTLWYLSVDFELEFWALGLISERSK